MLCSGVLSPAAALREVLFSPQLDITTELRDSSRVLGELIDFALRRLQAVSSSGAHNAGHKALELALSTVPFSLDKLLEQQVAATEAAGGVKRTVTKVSYSSTTNGSAGVMTTTTTSEVASAAAALVAVTSPKNMDVALTVEQELSLLDDNRENMELSAVGERMDQVSGNSSLQHGALSERLSHGHFA